MTVVTRCQEHPFFDGLQEPLEAECAACWALYYSQLPDDEELVPEEDNMDRTYAERVAHLDKFTRTIRTARTYLKKAQAWLYDDPPNVVEYWGLLEDAIQTAMDIVEQLPDDYFELTETPDFFGLRATLGDAVVAKSRMSDMPYENAQKLVTEFEKRALRSARLDTIARLENTEGRTPEEAESYLAKARALREGLDGG